MRQLKLNKSGIIIPVMSLGTWAFGGDAIWGKTDEMQAIDTARRAVEMGIVQIDTAPAYGMGKSEEILGEALKGIRDKVILSTKCGLSWDEGNIGQLHVERDGHRIVIYYVHYPVFGTYAVPVEETMDELNRMKKEGKIRAIGASNMNPEVLNEYCTYADIEIIQEKYSLLDRKVEETLLPVCQERKILLQAYSPLEQGVLTEQFRQKRDTPDQKRFVNKPWGKKECHERMLQMFDSWMDLCEKYNCQLEHLAIAWILKQPGVNILCGARKITHLESNIKGAEIALTEEDAERIRRDVESFL